MRKKIIISFVLCLLFTLFFSNKANAGTTPARIYVDTPISGQTIKSNFVIAGWALNVSGIKEVDISIDGVKQGAAQIGLPRQDVDKAFPSYLGGATSGFNYPVDINTITPGNHNISVKAVGIDGTSCSYNISIYKAFPSMYVDTPTSGQKIKSNFDIAGWALNASGIKEVDISIDGVKQGTAQIGISRLDVDKAFPGYPGGANSGFNYPVDINSITLGNHNISVKAIGNDGTTASTSYNINIYKALPSIYVDTPTSGQTIKSNFVIAGWALNVSGIKEVDISIDGAKQGTATIGVSRPDVDKAFPGYPGGANSGFNYPVDIMLISPGTHSINIQAMGNDGTTTSTSYNINIYKALPSIFVDTPASGQTIKNNFVIVGWALNASGIKEVDIYIDGTKDGTATIGVSRPDVDKAFPGYLGGVTSGFNYQIDTEKYSNGIHVLKVVSIGNDTSIYQTMTNISIINDVITYSNYNLSLSDMVNIQSGVGAQTDLGGKGWVNATKDQIGQYVNPNNPNPNNFMNWDLQFLKLNYMAGITAADLNTILNGKGVLSGKGQVFLDAAWLYNVSPIYLVSQALLETGNGTSALATGISVSQVNGQPVTTKTTYNMFGIGALDANANQSGSENAYNQGWFTVDDAIRGGIALISQDYINSLTNQQNTLYKMKWNPANPGTHQYATDIGWAYKQIYNIKKLLDQCKIFQLLFDIPKYLSN